MVRHGSPSSTASLFSSQEPNGGPRGRGWGRGQAKQSHEKTSCFVDHSKKRLPSPPFPVFNLITAPHSPNRSGLQSELFTRSSFCPGFHPPQPPEPSLEAQRCECQLGEAAQVPPISAPVTIATFPSQHSVWCPRSHYCSPCVTWAPQEEDRLWE